MKSRPYKVTQGAWLRLVSSSTGSNSTLVGTLPAVVDELLCGPLVQGDFHSPNPWDYTVTHVNLPSGSSYLKATYTSGPSKGQWVAEDETGYLCPTVSDFLPFGDLTFPSFLYNSALSKLNDKVRGSLDLAVDVAQAGQTARMFSAQDAAIRYAVSANWRAIVKGVSGAWLEFQYGWRPLAQSLYEATELMSNVAINSLESFSAQSSEHLSSGQISPLIRLAGATPGPVVRNGVHSCKIGVVIRTKSNRPDIWTSLNPASIAWELVPYSFVVDWFLGIGNYIRDLETSLLYANSFVTGYVSNITVCEASYTGSSAKSFVSGGVQYTSGCSVKGGGKYVKFNRTKLTSYPVPRLPSIRANLGSGRLLNAAALLTQKIKKAI